MNCKTCVFKHLPEIVFPSSVDATADNNRHGRLLNHSKTNPNVITKMVILDHLPYLCLVAGRDICEGEQLEYDYGDRSKMSIQSHPWLVK